MRIGKDSSSVNVVKDLTRSWRQQLHNKQHLMYLLKKTHRIKDMNRGVIVIED